MANSRPFVTAAWRHLVMLNYEVTPELLEAFVPRGTELDLWRGRAMVSLVGFQFLDTRFQNWPVPFHRHFEEVNLRFYIRRETSEGWRRGVAFLREIVPKFCVSWVANTFYHEHYLTLPMTHRVQVPASATDRTGLAVYHWRHGAEEFQIGAEFSGLPERPPRGSETEFIVEHYWGYSRRRDGSTIEYHVEHPPWRVWHAGRAWFTGDAASIYGEKFAAVLRQYPASALVAEGSRVAMVADASSTDSGEQSQSGNGWPLVSGANQMTTSPTR